MLDKHDNHLDTQKSLQELAEKQLTGAVPEKNNAINSEKRSNPKRQNDKEVEWMLNLGRSSKQCQQ